LIEDMAELHMSEAEVARDFAAALEKVVRHGLDVVVEHDRQPVAVLRPASPPRRKVSEVLALMSKNSTAAMDADFARDVQGAIDNHREPLEPRAWTDPRFREAFGGEANHGFDFVRRHVENLCDLFDQPAGFKILKDGLHGHTRSFENPRAADFTGDAFHGRALRPIQTCHVGSPLSELPLMSCKIDRLQKPKTSTCSARPHRER
jgi:hypothetical protein